MTLSVERQQVENSHMTNPACKSIADSAPSLADLKKLPFDRQVMLLLARLDVMPKSGGDLNRQNLKLTPGDLAIGYSPQEQLAVVDYLLGRPWVELINRGYLVEGGKDFYHVSEEGKAALSNTRCPPVSRAALEAVTLIHHDLAEAERDFREGKFKDAVRDAFRIFENRLNAIRDASRDPALHGKSGTALPHAFVKSSIFKFPFPKLSPTSSTALEAYKESLRNLLSGAIGFVRNAYDHEPYNLPDLDERSALELLFFASYLLRLIDLSR
jgi:hypothetical protein